MIDKMKIGDRIQVKAHEVLGTDAVMGTIVEVQPTHYVVHLDGDEHEWNGPVSFDGEILCNQF